MQVSPGESAGNGHAFAMKRAGAAEVRLYQAATIQAPVFLEYGGENTNVRIVDPQNCATASRAGGIAENRRDCARARSFRPRLQPLWLPCATARVLRALARRTTAARGCVVLYRLGLPHWLPGGRRLGGDGSAFGGTLAKVHAGRRLVERRLMVRSE